MSKVYIEKEAAKAMIQSNADGHLITDEEAAWIIADIDSIDAADVKPVVRGEWINIQFSINGGSNAECNRCGATVHTSFSSSINYCPNCGADMRKETRDG